MMSDLEKVIKCFKLVQEGATIPTEYDPEKWLKVYDIEQEYRPALITNITKTPDDYIAIEFKYTDNDDDAKWCYLLCDKLDVDLPMNDGNLNYVYTGNNKSSWFHYWFITENRVRKYRDKVWPKYFDGFDGLYLEYIETIDPTHANYKFCWYEKEYIVVLSREDINELLEDAESFVNELQDAIIIMDLDEKEDEG